MSRKRVTQADVARHAGVSQTAVSQILGNMGDESSYLPETREKVTRAAIELGYLPNRAARALRTNRTMTLGVVLSFITDELALRITQGIQEVAHERGYGILIADTDQNPALEAEALSQFYEREVDGLIFVDSWSDPDMFLGDDRYPPAIFAQLRQAVGLSNCVGIDNFRGGYEAARHLLDLGYRKVAHITGPENWHSAQERILGYCKALEDYHLPFSPSLIERGNWEVSGGVAATHALLDREPDVDAIFVSNDLMAAGCIQALAQRNLRVPGDIAVVGYDDRHLAQALLPPLTSYAISLNQIGQKAATLLIDRLLKDGIRQVPSMTIAGSLVVRTSCGAYPEK